MSFASPSELVPREGNFEASLPSPPAKYTATEDPLRFPAWAR